MKLIAISLASVVLLTGCSSILGGDSEADVKACEQLVSLTSAENLNLDALDVANLASEIRSKASSVAGEDFAGRIEALAAELETDPINTAATATIAGEIALRCAVVGVTFDLSGVTSVLG
ncbi:unannotated protein [freshwater metagenome]|uniref:Unannotated protein n=1 Tax=freshwater metagenome TaxID=449393 RepID=A0A6J6JEM8_9ZZZZ|nr:hypothetical protein [Actinomycetota bacterium]